MHSIHRFDSVGAYADHCEKIQASPAWRKAGYDERSQAVSAERTEFTGAETFQQALEFARLGWPAGLAALQHAKAAMPKPTARGRARRFDVAGMFPDAARAAAGDPCSMVIRAGERKGKQVLPLVMPGSTGCFVTAESIANQATAICGLIDALESSGVIRCELWRHLGIDAGDHSQSLALKLKSAEDSLELSRLAGALAPSTYRRLWFRFTESNAAPYWARSTHSDYGSPRPVSADAALFPGNALFLPKASNFDDTPAAAWASVKRWAAENGFPLDPA